MLDIWRDGCNMVYRVDAMLEIAMRTASLFKNGKNQAIRLPKEFEFKGVSEVSIEKDGESIIITPKRKSWSSFSEVEKADSDFLSERPDVLEEGRVKL